MNRNIWAIWISMVVSFVIVMTFTLMMMYVSPSGIVCVYENNLLIRDFEIVIGIFTTIVSVYLFGKITFTDGKHIELIARKDKLDLSELKQLKAHISQDQARFEG